MYKNKHLSEANRKNRGNGICLELCGGSSTASSHWTARLTQRPPALVFTHRSTEKWKKELPLLFSLRAPNSIVFASSHSISCFSLSLSLSLSFLFSKAHGLKLLRFEVALGYRDAVKGPWHRMARAKVTRTLDCQPNEWVGGTESPQQYSVIVTTGKE